MVYFPDPFCSLKFLGVISIRGRKEIQGASGTKKTAWHCTTKQLSQINRKINGNISNNTYNAGTKHTPKYKVFRQAAHLYSILHAISYRKQSTLYIFIHILF